MIGAPDLFRSWMEFGTEGLSEITRYARLEYRDGDWAPVPTAAGRSLREPTLLQRLASALGFRAAANREPRASPATHRPQADVYAPVAAVLMVSAEDCGQDATDCHAPW